VLYKFTFYFLSVRRSFILSLYFELFGDNGSVQVAEVSTFPSNRKVLLIVIGTCVVVFVLVVLIGAMLQCLFVAACVA